MTNVTVIIWTREQAICICPDVEAFFCFCLEALPAEGYSVTSGKGCLCSHIQNLSEWLRMGSQSHQHLQVFSLFLFIRRHRFMQVILMFFCLFTHVVELNYALCIMNYALINVLLSSLPRSEA